MTHTATLKRSWLAVGLFASALMLFGMVFTAQAADGASYPTLQTALQAEKQDGPLNFFGTLRDPSSDPVIGAHVFVHNADFSIQSDSATDDSGVFGVRGLPAGAYTIEFFLSPDSQGILPPDAIEATYAGVPVDLGVVVCNTATKTITGTITYDGGAPVTQAMVNAHNKNSGSNTNAAVNGSGQFMLLVDGGTWEVFPGAPFNEQGQEIAVDWSYNQPPTEVTFADNDTPQNEDVDFEVAQVSQQVRGRIVKPNGSPAAQGRVELSKGDGPGFGANTNQDGNFTIPCEAGTYRLNFFGQDGRYALPEQTVSVGEANTPASPKNLGTLTLEEKTSKIRGVVQMMNGNPVAGVHVRAFPAEPGGAGGFTDTQTGGDGTYQLFVSEGTWRVELGLDQNSGLVPEMSAQQVSVGNNQTVNGINFRLQASDASITARAVNEEGALVNTFGYVSCFVGDDVAPGPRKDSNEFGAPLQNGQAIISLLGGETYTCMMHLPQEESDYTVEGMETEEISDGEDATLNFTLLENDAVLRGQFRDQNGTAVTGVDGEVFVMDENFNWRGARLQENGRYELSLLGGRNYVLGYHFFGNAQYLQTHPDESNRFLVGVGATVTKDVTVPKAEATIHGTVLDPSGAPVPFAWVGASNFEAVHGMDQSGGEQVIESNTETNQDGEFNLPIIAGQFKVFAGLPPFAKEANFMPPQEQEVTIAAGETKNVTLRFKESDATLSGSVSLSDGSPVLMGFCHGWSDDGSFTGSEVFGGDYSLPLVEGTWHIGCDSKTSEGFFRSNEFTLAVATGDALTRDITLTEAGFEVPESFTKTFDSTTQQLITLPDGTVLNIPASAIASEGNVTIVAEPNVNLYHTSEAKPLTFAWDFTAVDANGAEITSFNSTITIVIPYDEEYIASLGLTEADLTANYFDDTANSWRTPASVSIDTENNTITVTTDHFTNYALTTGADVAGGAATGSLGILMTSASNGGANVRLVNEDGSQQVSFFAYQAGLRGEFKAMQADLDGDGTNEIIAVPGEGFGPNLRVFDAEGTLLDWTMVYDEDFRGGLNVAAGDVNGDGDWELVVAPMGKGGPHVRVYDFVDGSLTELASVMAYNASFRGGVHVAVGDVNGDGNADIVTAPEMGGGPNVRAFTLNESGDGLDLMNWFMAYDESFTGGVNIAVGDVNNDGTADVVTAPAAHGGPNVRVYKYAEDNAFHLLDWVLAYDESFHGGVNIVVGDLNGDGQGDIVTAPMDNGGPQVRTYSLIENVLTLVADDMAYDESFRGGLSLAIHDLGGDGTLELVVAPRTPAAPNVRVYRWEGDDMTLVDWFWGFAESFRGGVNLGQ